MARRGGLDPIIDKMKSFIHNEKDQSIVTADSVANDILKRLNPDDNLTPEIKILTLAQLRQLARPLLRKYFKPKEAIEVPDTLFPELQWRYPQEDQKGYILLRDMSRRDYLYNINLLDKKSRGFGSHRDRLAAHMEMYLDDDMGEEEAI